MVISTSALSITGPPCIRGWIEIFDDKQSSTIVPRYVLKGWFSDKTPLGG